MKNIRCVRPSCTNTSQAPNWVSDDPAYCSGDCARADAPRLGKKLPADRRSIPARVKQAMQELRDLKAGVRTVRGSRGTYSPSTGQISLKPAPIAKRTAWEHFDETDAAVTMLGKRYKLPIRNDKPEQRYAFVLAWAKAQGQDPQVREDVIGSLERAMDRDNAAEAQRLDALQLVEAGMRRGR